MTDWKKTQELAFLSEVSCVPLRQRLRHQHTAFKSFFDGRARYPRFKSRNGRQPAHYTRSGFRMKNGQLHVAKIDGPLAVTWSWPGIDLVRLDPSMVAISRESDGRWYVAFAVDADEPASIESTGHDVGVDLGIKDFAVTSDGQRISNPRHLERKARSLARYQRRLARCRDGSANRRKAKAKVARAHRKVRNARADLLHKTSTSLVRRADLIVVEDLAVKNMLGNRRLARAVSDCGWGEFRRQLTYKCERTGRTLVAIDRWYPSSKTCSTCGYLLAELDLSVRAWTCPGCRARHDRDLNAAKNILAAGRAVAQHALGDACGADVRRQGSFLPRSAMKQEAPAARRSA
ncbi:transposase [Actinoplanes regularis]|nr:transposase [Actinoplanes regularis]